MGKKNSNKIITRLKIMLFQFVVIFLFSLTLPLNAICILHMILFIQTKVKCMKTIQNASTSYRSRILECIYFPTNSVERVRTSDRDSKRYSDSESNEKKITNATKIRWRTDTEAKMIVLSNAISGNATIRKLKTSLVTSVSFIYEKNGLVFYAMRA